MVMKTKVVNKTSKDFILKEGTAGVYRLITRLKPDELYTINVDPNATYREYWCAVKDDDPKTVTLSSDDCQEYKEVRIKEKTEDSSYFWNGVYRKAMPSSNSEETSGEFFLWTMLKKLIPGSSKKDHLRTVRPLEEIVVKR